jgi:NhaP-type Na+/H+ or K+/H+ antiporter
MRLITLPIADKDHRVRAMTNASEDEGLRGSARRLTLVVVLAVLGFGFSELLQASSGVRLRHVSTSLPYSKSITLLLVIGLFASAFGISRRELRLNARVVLVAITFGVAVKAALTGGIMALAYGNMAFLLLGVAVAQIDPLSVAATIRHSGMSRQAKAVLSAWASFDDPVTILLVAYLASFTLFRSGSPAAGSLVGAGFGSYAGQIMLNAALVAVAGLAWYLITLRGRFGDGSRHALSCLVLAGLIAAAVAFNLLIGITVCGLFFRPSIQRIISTAVSLAFYTATFLLGMLLVAGVNIPAGILLGISVFLVQILTGALIGRRMSRRDRVGLALGQQNGLTAIVLALALQPYVPAAVGIIAIAVLVVNILYISANGAGELIQGNHSGPAKTNQGPAGNRRGRPPQEQGIASGPLSAERGIMR